MTPKSVLLLTLLLVVPAFGKPNDARGWLGFGFAAHHARDGHVDFLHVRNVAKQGPADRAGLKPFDVIVALNGTPVRFSDERSALAFFARIAVGERVVFTVARYGKQQQIRVIAAKPSVDQTAAWERNRALAQQRTNR